MTGRRPYDVGVVSRPSVKTIRGVTWPQIARHGSFDYAVSRQPCHTYYGHSLPRKSASISGASHRSRFGLTGLCLYSYLAMPRPNYAVQPVTHRLPIF
jgi:hypothetical protein